MEGEATTQAKGGVIRMAAVSKGTAAYFYAPITWASNFVRNFVYYVIIWLSKLIF